MKRVVVALGGNALLARGDEDSAEAMRRSARHASEVVAGIAEAGWEVVVTHGNGPQVGRILLQQEAASGLVAPMPLDVCDAESQGQIGYLLQANIGDVFYERGMDRPVVTILTLTRVPRDDPAFAEPTKPIGPYYEEPEAKRLMTARGWAMAPAPGDDGKWRRLVPSPHPYSIVEAPVIRRLVAEGVIVIAAGGGGVPVVEDGPRLVGVEGVVDKDLAACILARDVEADALMIATDVEGVFERFGTAEQRLLSSLPAEEARRRLDDGEFGEGSMKPKVEAAVQFVAQGGRRAIITSLHDAGRALAGEAGTQITL
ncbi:MAG TPA: carbamate kinase [Actinomycetota bacterium]|nr:carbamate kinase [Actinomycetota bacterium]